MFLGMMPRRPDKATAYKELKTNLKIAATFIAVIRIAPYVLHFLTNEKEELRLEL